MATKHLIECEKCTSHRWTVRQNTRLCAFHSFARDWQFANKEGRTRICACGAPFSPLIAGQKFCHGPDCLEQHERHGISECVYCHKVKPRVHADVAICFDCAEDPANRDAIAEAIVDKSRRLRANPVRFETAS